jgi:hypothetical protein
LGQTVRELEETLSYAEFNEWKVFFALEPWGAETDDARTALVARTIANGLRGPNTEPFSIADFMPRRGAPPAPVEEPPLTDDELCAWADAAIYGLPPE